MSLTPELTADQIDDWFRIGKKAVTVKGIPKSASGGRFIDPETRKPRAPSVPDVPHYKRHPTFHGGFDYAAKYQQEEEERLMERSVLGDQSDVASVLSSRLEALEVDSTIAGSSVLPADLAPPNATDVYNHYSFQPNYDSKLPITHFKEQVIATVESNQVTVIQGATGSGKTTQVAQYILDHYAEQNKYCNIIVTQPRRIAAISIARRVCQERDWQLGTVCGYQVGLEKNASPDTRILYCTTGILLNKLINEKNMHQYSHVILDEVHERDQNTDFCLLVVRKLLRTNSQHTRVILMSATFDSDLFAQYFALPVCDRLEQAPVVNVQGKPYRVSEFYAEDLQKLGEVPTLDEQDPSISLQAKQLALKLVEEFDKMEEKEQGLSPTGFAHIRGTVLMFLPGLSEITLLEEALVKMKDRHRLFIIPLHSSITMDAQNNVFCQPEPGIRKVILSTNIAESSITVPDIKYVIDFCLTKNLETDFETNYTSLQISWASKANCIQRKGRAGRVSNGRVYRLVTRYFYETFFQEYTKPEMQRCPLDKLILQVKVLNLGEPKAILALALSPPNLDDIERNILLLKEIGALANSVISHYGVNKHDGELTFVGRVLADLPVDTKIGKLLILGHVFGLLDECLIIGAAMSQKSIFTKPFKQKLEAYRHKLEWSSSSLSDSLAILYAFKNWERKKETGEFRRAVGGGEKQWANQHYLQIRRLKEVTELMKELEKHLLKFNIERPKHEPHYKRAFSESQELLLLKVVLCGAFYPNYFTRGEIDELESHKSLSGKNPLNTVMVKGLPASHSHLYKESVEDLFRRYIPNPKASFEETRAYVEFPWRNANKSKVHPGVYVALKMKQLRMPFSVDISSRETPRSRQQMSDLMAGPAVQHGQVNRDRRTGEVLETYEVGSSRVGKHVAMPRVDQDVVRVFVSNVQECGHFWIQYSEPANFNELKEIQTCLNRDRGLSLRPFSTKVRVGMFCVAPYLELDEVEYYRAHVISIHNQFDERLQAQREMSEVYYVDYGNTSTIPSQDLRELPSDLLNQHFQAVECQLIKVRPSPIKCPDGRWTHEANEVFKQTVLNQEMYIRPFSVVHGILRVELVHTSPFQYYVSQKLIEEGYADETEESNLSKQTNEQRIEEFAVMRSQSNERNRDTKLPQRTLAEAAAEARQFSGSHPLLGDDQRNTRINLTGPSNPYEMSFNSLTSVGRLRTVRVEQDSVNSICVDDEPYTPNQRLMIAGFVGLNSNRSTMMARDTTLMPLIPGLVHLIPLVFTPMAEFRIDEQKTKYTGAICGLGTDPRTGHSLLPDNDMELVFDVNITHDDLVKINAIRIAINFAIGSRDAVSGWGEGAIYIIQKRARDSLMDLIQKRREPCEMVSPRYPYQWNRLDNDDIMPPSVDKDGMATLLSLHSGVCLENASEVTTMSPETERMLSHLKHLREVVKQKKARQLIVCELCNVPCPSHQLLALHLETQRHKTAEEALLKPQREK